jgi:hypothetical protein
VLVGGLKELMKSEVLSVLNYLDKVDICLKGQEQTVVNFSQAEANYRSVATNELIDH